VQYDQNKTCNGPEGKPIMGGFGWLDQGSGECLAYVDLEDGTVGSDPGLDPPKNCDSLLHGLQNATTPEERTIYLPIYKCNSDPEDADCSNGINGQHGEFVIWQFAAFEVTGWMFSGVGNALMYNPDPNAPGCTANNSGTPGGGGPKGGNQGGGNQGGNPGGGSNNNNCRGIQGFFKDYISLEAFAALSTTPSGTGLTAVKLID